MISKSHGDLNMQYAIFVQIAYAYDTILLLRVQDEINMVNRQATKQIEAKGAIHALNEFLKRQISLIKEEGELKLEVYDDGYNYVKY